MKFKKILGILGVTLILTLLLAAVPAMPTLAVGETISLSPSSGKVGDTVTVYGDSFTAYEPGTHEYWAEIYFSKDSANVNQAVGGTNSIPNTYNFVGESSDSIDASGTFEASFKIPTRLTNGTDDEDVTVGTYYVFATLSRDDTGDNNVIKAKATFTVTASGSINPLSVTSGAGGTQVTISGSNFQVSYPIIFKLDNTILTPTGDSYTNTSGSFTSYITIPQDAVAGSHTISVTVGTSSVSTPFTVTASATLNTLSATTGPPGTQVTISGSNFLPSYPIIIKFDSTTLTPVSGDASTNTAGGFASQITIPEGSTPGVHTISVTVGTVTLTAQENFTVTAPATTTTTTTTTPLPTTTTTTKPPTAPVLSINASGHNVGADIGMSGTGFTPSATINVSFDGENVGSAKSDANGTLVVIFKVPAAKHGDHTITASDGTHTGTTTFTIESDPPETPQPVAPAMDVKVKSPVTFEWEAATDVSPPSEPLTYELQIATAESFSSGLIILDKTGLTDTTYTLTPAEELELTGKAPYYWRIRSLDAASNPSPWTGAGVFYASGSSSFPSWALYTILGVGAVLVFLIGYWLGRRSAFYY
jgi:hypothetical protein